MVVLFRNKNQNIILNTGSFLPTLQWFIQLMFSNKVLFYNIKSYHHDGNKQGA